MISRIMAVGDIFLQTRIEGGDPFAGVGDELAKADIVFGNLEVPVTGVTSPAIEKASPLRSAPGNMAYLKNARFSVVNLANNHLLDHGVEGALETMSGLEGSGIGYVGAGRNVIDCFAEALLERNGKTIAFVGFYDQAVSPPSGGVCIAGMDQQFVIYRIAELKSRYDFVLVSIHWGIENVFYPSPGQQSLARDFIDAGASAVLGHHPHRLQGVERYREGIIFYSLGNFNFENCGVGLSPYPDLSAIADIRIEDDGRLSYELVAVKIGDDYSPRILTGDEDLKIFNEHVSNISGPLEQGVEKWWWYGEIAGPYLSGNFSAFLSRIKKYGISHFFQMIAWLGGRFPVKCYIGLLRKWLGLNGTRTRGGPGSP